MAKFSLKKLEKDLIRNDILIPHIDLYQAKGKFPDEWIIFIKNTKEKDKFFHPSGDCFTDPVQLFLEKTEQVKRQSPNTSLRRIFDCGHFWHGYYQNILFEMGFVIPEHIEYQATFEKYGYRDGESALLWTGRGTLDLFQVDIPGHSLHIVDMKTMNDTEFDEGPRPDTFKKWEAQVNCYMDWTGHHDAIVLAVRKGGIKNPVSGRPQHDLKEFRIQYKPELLKEIYGRWEQAQRYIDGKESIPT